MSRYIDADLLLEKIKPNSRYFNVICAIESAPTADVNPIVYGEWIAKNFHTVTCSNCNDFDLDIMKDYQFEKYLHCPNCGATMRKESEEER